MNPQAFSGAAIGVGSNSAYATVNAKVGTCSVQVSITAYEGSDSDTFGEAAQIVAELAADIEESLRSHPDAV